MERRDIAQEYKGWQKGVFVHLDYFSSVLLTRDHEQLCCVESVMPISPLAEVVMVMAMVTMLPSSRVMTCLRYGHMYIRTLL